MKENIYILCICVHNYVNIYIHIYIFSICESLCCIAEINATLEIKYT